MHRSLVAGVSASDPVGSSSSSRFIEGISDYAMPEVLMGVGIVVDISDERRFNVGGSWNLDQTRYNGKGSVFNSRVDFSRLADWHLLRKRNFDVTRKHTGRPAQPTLSTGLYRGG